MAGKIKTRAWREDKGMAGRQGHGGKTRTWREDKDLAGRQELGRESYAGVAQKKKGTT